MTRVEFAYTGAAQTWTVPTGVTSVLIEAWGAAAVAIVGRSRGGYVQILQTVTPGESLQINVGGSSGWNGGGTGAVTNGAGASDVRRGGTALANRICIAGGAGAGSWGGSGGGDIGQSVRFGLPLSPTATGGTQSAGGMGPGPSAFGALGTGGNGDLGGGGGYYGGGGNTSSGQGGGGGSNYPATASAKQSIQGVSSPDGSLNGYVAITTVGVIAAADAGNAPPRVLLTAITLASSTVTINRVDAAGNQTPVRTANPATLVSDLWVGYDYEAPYNEPVTYIAVSDTGESYTSNTVTVSSDVGWLVHPGTPALSIPLTLGAEPADFTIESVGTKTRATNIGVHNVLSSRTPITVSDGQRRAPTFDVTIRSTSLDAETALVAILDDAGVLLLQIVGPATDRSIYEWVSIGDITEAPLIDGYFPGQYERWVLPCTVTTAPSGLLQAEWSWADVITGYATWQDVLDAFPTWQDLILNTPVV